MEQAPFPGMPGLPENLMPHPPGEIPEAPGAGDATKSLSPFLEAQSAEDVIKNLVLDRPLKLFVPNKEKFPGWEFHIINSIPSEIAAARMQGWREVTDPDLVDLFRDLVAGTDKTGNAYRPILCARQKQVGDHIRKTKRRQLQGIYAGMDPQNKTFDTSKYTRKVGVNDGTFGDFSGANWRIRV